MKFFTFLFFLFSYSFCEDFITLKEYAKMLYENPRGISCKSCHGAKGNEQILGYYIKNGEKIPYKIPSIKNISFKKFKASLMEIKNTNSIMPTYSLTNDEIIALYKYINEEK